MTYVEQRIAGLKARLDSLRPVDQAGLPTDLQRAYDIELTYSSNAIEGNTLTHGETAELIEHGLVAGGKSMKDHLEMEDHYAALQWMRTFAAGRETIDEGVVIELHRRTMLRSRDDIAGRYAQFGRRIAGSPVVLPNPAKVPTLMERFGANLAAAGDGPRPAFDAHYRLVTIHPFDDGNGRTARLLANLMLLRRGYVPVSVRPEDRSEYLDTLKAAQLAQDDQAPAFQAFMLRRLEETLQTHIADLGREGRPTDRTADLSGKDDGQDRPGPTGAQLAHLAALRGLGR